MKPVGGTIGQPASEEFIFHASQLGMSFCKEEKRELK
jgi:hypothetical protein